MKILKLNSVEYDIVYGEIKKIEHMIKQDPTFDPIFKRHITILIKKLEETKS